MKNFNIFIQEKLKLNKDINVDDKSIYKSYGEGSFEELDVEDFLKDTFNIKLKDNDSISFYSILRSYNIDPDTKFYHIQDKNVDKNLSTKIYIMCRNDENSKSSIMTIGPITKSTACQVKFYNIPNEHLFIVLFIKHHLGHLINEYFLYID